MLRGNGAVRYCGSRGTPSAYISGMRGNVDWGASPAGLAPPLRSTTSTSPGSVGCGFCKG
eukprot:13930208-Heterocapsa_arctica.AAC.1